MYVFMRPRPGPPAVAGHDWPAGIPGPTSGHSAVRHRTDAVSFSAREISVVSQCTVSRRASYASGARASCSFARVPFRSPRGRGDLNGPRLLRNIAEQWTSPGG